MYRPFSSVIFKTKKLRRYCGTNQPDFPIQIFAVICALLGFAYCPHLESVLVSENPGEPRRTSSESRERKSSNYGDHQDQASNLTITFKYNKIVNWRKIIVSTNSSSTLCCTSRECSESSGTMRIFS